MRRRACCAARVCMRTVARLEGPIPLSGTLCQADGERGTISWAEVDLLVPLRNHQAEGAAQPGALEGAMLVLGTVSVKSARVAREGSELADQIVGRAARHRWVRQWPMHDSYAGQGTRTQR